MTLAMAFDMIDRGLTPEEYEKRWKRMLRLQNEQERLEDKISVFTNTPNDERCVKAKKRLPKVIAALEKVWEK